MDRVEDIEITERCADCGAEIAELEWTFAVSDESVICYQCATRRGGAYDELEDRWKVEPKVEDLLERERPT